MPTLRLVVHLAAVLRRAQSQRRCRLGLSLEEYVTELIKGQADGEPRRVEIEAEA